MGLKDFLKPTIWKIILTIILVILFFFNLTTNPVACPEALGYDCSKQISEARSASITYTLISIIPLYLLACLIIWIIKKIKK